MRAALAAAVRGSPSFEAGGGAGGGEAPVDLVDAEVDDRGAAGSGVVAA